MLKKEGAKLRKIFAKLALFAILFAILTTAVTSVAEPKDLELDNNKIFPSSKETVNKTINNTTEIIENISEFRNNEIIISFPNINDTILNYSKPNNKETKNLSKIDKLKNCLKGTNNYFNSLPKENCRDIFKKLKDIQFLPNTKETNQKRIEFLEDVNSKFSKININILDNTNSILENFVKIPFAIGKIIPLKIPIKFGNDREIGNAELVGASLGSVFLIGYLTSSTSSKYSSFFLPIPLYSRIKKEKVLEHKTRDEIYSFVAKHPGASRLAIKKNLNLANGCTGHHLRTLEREGYIKSIKHGRLRKFYVCGTKVSELSEIQEKIAKIIEQNPGITQIEIAKKINVSRQAVNYQIKYLTEKGIIYVVTTGRKTACFFKEQAS